MLYLRFIVVVYTRFNLPLIEINIIKE